MDQNVVKNRPFADSNSENEDLRVLMLHNDNVNTFDFVISTLIQVCKHDAIQAEQCAFITHHKGRCDIRVGAYKQLEPMKSALIERGLQVTIE